MPNQIAVKNVPQFDTLFFAKDGQRGDDADISWPPMRGVTNVTRSALLFARDAAPVAPRTLLRAARLLLRHRLEAAAGPSAPLSDETNIPCRT